MEAGADPVLELAFTVADGLEYCRIGVWGVVWVGCGVGGMEAGTDPVLELFTVADGLEYCRTGVWGLWAWGVWNY